MKFWPAYSDRFTDVRREPRGYRADIDLLRAVSVSAVIVYHLGLGMPAGFLGVDVFFVLSGFLITEIVYQTVVRDKDFSFFRFYIARIRRLAPSLATLIVLSSILAIYLLPDDRLNQFLDHLPWALFGLFNFRAMGDSPYDIVEFKDSLLLHTWSLGVETQFYVLFPILFILVWRLFGKHRLIPVILVAAILSFGTALLFGAISPSENFFSPLTRAWELLAGALLSLTLANYAGFRASPRLWDIIYGAALIILFGAFFSLPFLASGPGAPTLVPVGATLVCLWAGKYSRLAGAMSHSSVAFLGKVSYSLYLFHFPIIAFLWDGQGTGDGERLFKVLLLIFATSLANYFFIERPARFGRLKNPLLGGTVIVLAASLVFAFTRIDLALRPSILTSMPVAVDSRIEYGPIGGQEKATNKYIILLGDSQMAALGPSLSEQAEDTGFSFASWTSEGCPFIIGVSRLEKATNRVSLECDSNLQDKRLAWLTNFPPSYVVLGGRLPLVLEGTRFDNKEGGQEGEMLDYFAPDPSKGSDHGFQDSVEASYLQTVDLILSMGHSVVQIYPIPEVGWHVPDRAYELARAQGWPLEESVSTSFVVFRERTESSRRLLDSISGTKVFRIYPEHVFCNTFKLGRCSAHSDEEIYYRDNNHLSRAGGDLLASEIMGTILGSLGPKTGSGSSAGSKTN